METTTIYRSENESLRAEVATMKEHCSLSGYFMNLAITLTFIFGDKEDQFGNVFRTLKGKKTNE